MVRIARSDSNVSTGKKWIAHLVREESQTDRFSVCTQLIMVKRDEPEGKAFPLSVYLPILICGHELGDQKEKNHQYKQLKQVSSGK